MRPMDVSKDGRTWRIGTAGDVAWLAGQTTQGVRSPQRSRRCSTRTATFHPPDGVSFDAHERAVVDELSVHTADQPWWLGYLDTGAHDIVFPHAPKVSLYWDWPYVLVEAGPEQALTWRTGHMRGERGAARPVLPRGSLLARLRPLGRPLDRHRRHRCPDCTPCTATRWSTPAPSGPTRTRSRPA